MNPPFIPILKKDDDLSYFDEAFTSEPIFSPPEDTLKSSPNSNKLAFSEMNSHDEVFKLTMNDKIEMEWKFINQPLILYHLLNFDMD